MPQAFNTQQSSNGRQIHCDNIYTSGKMILLKKSLKIPIGVIRSRKLKKNEQCNGQKEKVIKR
jgi:hypothetical protein